MACLPIDNHEISLIVFVFFVRLVTVSIVARMHATRSGRRFMTTARLIIPLTICPVMKNLQSANTIL